MFPIGLQGNLRPTSLNGLRDLAWAREIELQVESAFRLSVLIVFANTEAHESSQNPMH